MQLFQIYKKNIWLCWLNLAYKKRKLKLSRCAQGHTIDTLIYLDEHNIPGDVPSKPYSSFKIVDLPTPGGPITPTTVKSVLSVKNCKRKVHSQVIIHQYENFKIKTKNFTSISIVYQDCTAKTFYKNCALGNSNGSALQNYGLPSWEL